jgi:hypothetical protein
LEESEGEIFGPASLFFFVSQKFPPDNHSIKFFHKSLAIFFAFAEPCHILSTEEADDGTRGSAKHPVTAQMKIEAGQASKKPK